MAKISVSKTTGERFLVLEQADLTATLVALMDERAEAARMLRELDAQIEAEVRAFPENAGRDISVWVKFGRISIGRKREGTVRPVAKPRVGLGQFWDEQDASGAAR